MSNKKNRLAKYFILAYIFTLVAIIAYFASYRERNHIPNSLASCGAYGPFAFSNKSPPPQKSGDDAITFQDLAGINEAVEELREIQDYMQNQEKYQALGARIPKGVLLSGPPGTGKTLIAKAIASECGLPFFSISGSEFIEKYVGVGASRVRDLFEGAKQEAPAIIFIDEIDAIGATRDLHDENTERIQTLNQLLTEMDGFNKQTNIIVLAATNRIEALDPALLRSGRFDRVVYLSLPDLAARHEILSLHAEKIPLADDVDLMAVAKMTAGASGADLANVLNEAALLTARKNETVVGQQQLEEARNRVLFGNQGRKLILSDKEKIATAYHEAGHAMVSHLLEYAQPAEKVTIVPRGLSLGHTEFSAEDNKHSYWEKEMLDQLAVMLGGRVAEEIFLEDVSSGASNDLIQATTLAKNMVINWGMSKKLGLPANTHFSEKTAEIADSEIRQLLALAYEKAKYSLMKYREQTETLAQALVEHETLYAEDIKQILQGTYPPLVHHP